MSRLLIALCGGVAAIVVAVVFLWPAPPTGPEPIAYGIDACAQCRMILGRPGFAGELRTADGALHKYDDIGCLLRAMVQQRSAMPEAWVEDHDGSGFVPLLGATLVRLSDGDTPMGHGVVAFADASAAQRFAAAHTGSIAALESLVRDPTILARAAAPRDEKRDPR